jgi:hypothetical protein
VFEPLVEAHAHVARSRGHPDVDAVNRIHHLLEPGEVDDAEVIHADVGQVLDGLDQQRRAAKRVGSIGLFLPRPGMSTQLSRGIDVTEAELPSAANLASMITSLRCEPALTLVAARSRWSARRTGCPAHQQVDGAVTINDGPSGVGESGERVRHTGHVRADALGERVERAGGAPDDGQQGDDHADEDLAPPAASFGGSGRSIVPSTEPASTPQFSSHMYLSSRPHPT